MKLTWQALSLMEADTGADAQVVGEREVIRAWQASQMAPEEADGIYGPKTGAALWAAHKPARSEIVARALAACTEPVGDWPAVTYSMKTNTGMGEAFFELGPFKTGDCSDFAAHCMALPKHYKRRWYGTDNIVGDARGYGELYEEIEWAAVAPGDLVVYGGTWADGKRTKIGHVGVVVEVDGDRIKTVDCASSNKRRYGSAVAMVDKTDFWRRKRAIIARPMWL